MTRLKDITFESNSLTGTNGADSTTGASISVDGTSALKGTYSAKIAASAGTGYVQESWTATDTVYISLYVKISSGPAAAAVICDLRDASGGIYRLRADSTDIWLADGSNTQIGSKFAYTTNTAYRLGLRYTKGTGANAIAEFFAIAGDSAFGAATASTSAGAATVQSDRVRIGATNSQTSTFFIDNIRVDDTSMPTDDVAGGTTYNQSVNVSAANTTSVTKQANKIVSTTEGNSVISSRQTNKIITATEGNTTTIAKQANKNVNASAGTTVTLPRSINKIISAAVSNVTSITKTTQKILTITENVTVALTKRIGKTVATSAASIVNVATQFIAAGSNTFTQSINVVVSSSVSISKRIDKRIQVVVSSIAQFIRTIAHILQYSARNSAIISLQQPKTGMASPEQNDGTLALPPNDSTTISIPGSNNDEL